ncbi:claudin-4-like [Poecilia reticulata]|uniref:claudin-4-like n=1 Tax=Poecilia reticulata TaxID=8081 RepID=UPI0004A22606|nr:PREDICTED: claudin-4-like [Poecilia reticulata]
MIKLELFTFQGRAFHCSNGREFEFSNNQEVPPSIPPSKLLIWKFNLLDAHSIRRWVLIVEGISSDMPSAGFEILGVTLALLGWISAIVSCALPMWRVSAFIGVNIVTAQTIWEGIWMSCVVQSTGQMQCKVYDSMLALSADLQAARALTIISIVLGVLGFLMSVMGAKCTNCVDEEAAKARVMIASGGAFVLASLTQIIPVSWSAHTIIMEFYSLAIPEAQKREIGAALYLGWAAAAFLLIGGGILSASCPRGPEKRYRTPYSQTRSVVPSGYDRRDYV